MEYWNNGIMVSAIGYPLWIAMESIPGLCPKIPLFHHSIIPVKNPLAMLTREVANTITCGLYKELYDGGFLSCTNQQGSS
jgi:hypothetical protein